jgi:hypothetical protein
LDKDELLLHLRVIGQSVRPYFFSGNHAISYALSTRSTMLFYRSFCCSGIGFINDILPYKHQSCKASFSKQEEFPEAETRGVDEHFSQSILSG